MCGTQKISLNPKMRVIEIEILFGVTSNYSHEQMHSKSFYV